MGGSALPLTTFLVAARIDRGTRGVLEQHLHDQMNEMGFSRYFATSAKRGIQIQELRQAIEEAIDWSGLPEINSPQLFKTMKTFLLTEKQRGRLLVAINDLYAGYLQDSGEAIPASNPLIEFTTCIGRLETAGLVQHLSFGDLVLLQPEALDAYASALLHTVKDDPEGLGSILIERVYQGDFPVPEEHRLSNPSLERLLLIAMIEDLLRRELALKDESYLIFPTEAMRLLLEAPEVRQYSIFFTFAGPIHNIYATLVVRLARSEFFHKQDFWKNAITYRASVGGICGIRPSVIVVSYQSFFQEHCDLPNCHSFSKAFSGSIFDSLQRILLRD